MENIKYTNDNKKVRVIGQLNSKETIVQEIFISNGNEIPSGENFIAKSLHDAPVISWKEEKVIAMDKKYKEAVSKFDTEMDALRNKSKKSQQELRLKIKYINSFISNESKTGLDLLGAFLLDEIKYIVDTGYSPKIIDYKTFMCEYSGDRLRLLCFYGDDNGSLSLGVNRYSDGSGGWNTYIPCKTKEDAIRELKHHIESKTYIFEGLVSIAEEYGFTLNKTAYSKYKTDRISAIKKNMEESKKKH